jgi:two-component system capsular synthesis sensor histidine kinase RcsC
VFAAHRIANLAAAADVARNESESKSVVFSHLSHDIRSPLHNLRAILALLLDDPSSGLPLIPHGLANCDRMEELVQDILDFARYQGGALEAKPACFDLVHTLTVLVESFTPAARLKGINLVIRPAERHSLAYADEGQMKRVLANLLSNALKYTPHGGIRVVIQESSARSVCVVIEDDGIGMTADQVARLFTPFSRFHPSMAEGTGLGLHLSKVLVELNGGRIHATSIAGQGSTFVLQLPRGAESGVVHPSTAHRGHTSIRVVLIDDDPEIVSTLGGALQKEGMDTIGCTSVREALGHIRRGGVEAIVTDLGMPDGGARSLVATLRAERRAVPVLVLSGRGEGVPEGTTSLMKPSPPHAIAAWIRRATSPSTGSTLAPRRAQGG